VIKIVGRQGDGEIGRSGKQKSEISGPEADTDMDKIGSFRKTTELNFLTRKVEV
jgi:hypothetical protein